MIASLDRSLVEAQMSNKTEGDKLEGLVSKGAPNGEFKQNRMTCSPQKFNAFFVQATRM